MAGYNKTEILLTEEIDQIIEEGKCADKDKLLREIAECGGNVEKLKMVYEKMCALPMCSDYPYTEPSEYEKILAASAYSGKDEYTPVDFGYFHGAWLGRCIGCAMGQPVEGWQNKDIVEWCKTAGRYPNRFYFPAVSGERRNEGGATDEKIQGMPLDDDTRFTVIAYKLLQNKGYDFDTYDVGDHWARTLPIRYICTAETQAYLNFVSVDEFGPWGRPENALEKLLEAKVNTYMNPYREFIGAQIRIDGYAYAAAGMPALAAKLAYMDASLSHVKNGVYGAMFFCAFISAAFTEKDINKCFQTALSFIPAKSRFYEEALKAREIAFTSATREELIQRLVTNGKRYNWVHTLNNAAICIGAVMYSQNDFADAVSIAVECGYDTDCNGATVGSFMGALLGESGIPEYLKVPIKDTFSVGISPYDNYSIKQFAKECMELRTKLNQE
ncbi:MAG: ADP-ribosylglycohydrolase family protein [Ruminococcaceae bacterium]|nr:ADP-ribosylglycohydrolase family protein [Oscillospiraceae bacterium]